MPGLLVQLGIFGGLFVGFGIIAEWRSGVIERQLVTPATPRRHHHRADAARCGGDHGAGDRPVRRGVLHGAAGADRGVAGRAGAGGLLGAAFSFISNAIGIATKSEDALAPMVNTLALPILLLSGILLPMTLAPPGCRSSPTSTRSSTSSKHCARCSAGEFVDPDRRHRAGAGGGAGGAGRLAREPGADGADQMMA